MHAPCVLLQYQGVTWQKVFQLVKKTMTFESTCGNIGQAHLGGHVVVVSARQGVVIEGTGTICKGWSPCKAVLEPSQNEGPPSRIPVLSCFVGAELVIPSYTV